MFFHNKYTHTIIVVILSYDEIISDSIFALISTKYMHDVNSMDAACWGILPLISSS